MKVKVGTNETTVDRVKLRSFVLGRLQWEMFEFVLRYLTSNAVFGLLANPSTAWDVAVSRTHVRLLESFSQEINQRCNKCFHLISLFRKNNWNHKNIRWFCSWKDHEKNQSWYTVFPSKLGFRSWKLGVRNRMETSS